MLKLALAVVCATAVPALADGICVTTDAARDRLGEDDRAAAMQVLEGTIAASGRTLGPPCTETWTVTHTRLGSSVQVLVVTPHGSFTASAPFFEQLGAAYESILARTASHAPPAATPITPVTPPPLVLAPVDPGARGAIYVRIGYGVAPATSSDIALRLGPTFGVGFRRMVGERLLIDASAFNTHVWKKPVSHDYDANITSFVRLAGHYVFPVDASSAFYVGGGVSFGQDAFAAASASNGTIYDVTQRGYAVQLEPTIGYEVLRDSATRVFFEAWATLPLDTVSGNSYSGATGSYWVPTFNLSAGLSFQP